MKIISEAYTTTGRRNNNEDALCVDPGLGLYLVADGMGGYEGGEVASGLAVETIKEFLELNDRDDALTWPCGANPCWGMAENLTRAAILLAHKAILSNKRGPLEKMGTTVAMMLVKGAEVILGHVGDSRIYRLRDGELTQLTRDHSLYNQMIDAGMDPLPDTTQYAYGHVITRALGFDSRDNAPDLARLPIEPGDIYLLCTDGLTDGLDDEAICRELSASDPGDTCKRLAERAYAQGSKDNITAVVVRAAA